eukprot:Gb_17342 [translate_table: standard]
MVPTAWSMRWRLWVGRMTTNVDPATSAMVAPVATDHMGNMICELHGI